MKLIEFVRLGKVVVNTLVEKIRMFKKMRKNQNILKLFICAFAITGIFACSSGGGGGGASTSTEVATPDGVTLTDRVNQDSLTDYTLANLGDTFLNEIEQEISADTSIDSIRITISNNGDSTSVTFTVSGDNWKTTPIDISQLGIAEGENTVTITIAYLYLNGDVSETETTTMLTIFSDSTAPSIKSFTEIDTLPITNEESFTFNITFNENINTDTFTAEDFIILPEDIVSINDITFDSEGIIATITATTDIPATQDVNLVIALDATYEDIVGNKAIDIQQLYEIDVQLPTVSAVNYLVNEENYSVIYTFSEKVVGITNSNFVIVSGDIIGNVEYTAADKVTLTVTSVEGIITIRAKGFADNSGNIGNEANDRQLNFNLIGITQNLFKDADFTPINENTYSFVLGFSEAISADSLTTSDFIFAEGNIQILNIITATADVLITDAIVNFKFIDPNDTAKVDFTIGAGDIENSDQTNDEAIVISIDRAPRIISIDGDLDGIYNIATLDEKNNSLSVTLDFSEPIKNLSLNDIVTAGVGITPTLMLNNDTEATLTIEIATEIQAELTLFIEGGVYDDLEGNTNIETTYSSPQVYRIDNVQPSIESFTDIALPITGTFTFDITFNEDISTDTFTTSDFMIAPEGLITITTVDFNGNKNSATITVTTDTEALATATENLIISVGKATYEDEVGNTPDENQDHSTTSILSNLQY